MNCPSATATYMFCIALSLLSVHITATCTVQASGHSAHTETNVHVVGRARSKGPAIGGLGLSTFSLVFLQGGIFSKRRKKYGDM